MFCSECVFDPLPLTLLEYYSKVLLSSTTRAFERDVLRSVFVNRATTHCRHRLGDPYSCRICMGGAAGEGRRGGRVWGDGIGLNDGYV